MSSLMGRWCSGGSIRTHLSSSCSTAVHEMRAWRLHSYKEGVPQGLSYDKCVTIPSMKSSHDVLIKVAAASLNPLDSAMSRGYGRQVFRAFRGIEGEDREGLPLILGRDFSGTVVDVATDAGDSFRPGDQVWGTIFPGKPGSHADYCLASTFSLSRKPKSLSHVEAASLPYVALTAWGALAVTGELGQQSKHNNPSNVLVLGAAGGVGTLAVQLLKAWGCQVVATCKDDAFEMVYNLGADVVLDYTSQQFLQQLKSLAGKFNVILDCTTTCKGKDGLDYRQLLQPWSGAKYITLSSPVLAATDRYGLLIGTFGSAADLVVQNLKSFSVSGFSHRWGYFMSNWCALETLAKLVDNEQIRPVIQETFRFDQILEAYKLMDSGSARGKIVLDMGADA